MAMIAGASSTVARRTDTPIGGRGEGVGTPGRVVPRNTSSAVVVPMAAVHSSAWSAAVPRPEGCPGYRKYGAVRSRQNALLAQSVEHSHGKAGVVGSIPTEGSPPPRRGGLAA